MKYLSECIRQLSDELLEEQKANELLKSHVDGEFHKLKEVKARDSFGDQNRSRQLQQAKSLLHQAQQPQAQHVRCDFSIHLAISSHHTGATSE